LTSPTSSTDAATGSLIAAAESREAGAIAAFTGIPFTVFLRSEAVGVFGDALDSFDAEVGLATEALPGVVGVLPNFDADEVAGDFAETLDNLEVAVGVLVTAGSTDFLPVVFTVKPEDLPFAAVPTAGFAFGVLLVEGSDTPFPPLFADCTADG
jgi:hypothetical protein